MGRALQVSRVFAPSWGLSNAVVHLYLAPCPLLHFPPKQKEAGVMDGAVHKAVNLGTVAFYLQLH